MIHHNKKTIAASLLSFGILAGGSFTGSSTALAAPAKAANVYTNYQSDTVQALRNGNQGIKATYTSATGSMRSVDPGWIYLYDKAYYVKKDNTWAINEKLTIDGKSHIFNSEGIATPIEEVKHKTQEVKNFRENMEQARNWGKDHYKKRKWSEEDKNLVNIYTKMGCAKHPNIIGEYVGINPDLRSGEARVKPYVEKLDQLFQKTSESIIVYRRISENSINIPGLESIVQGAKIDKNKFKFLKEKMKNKNLEDLGYLSTSLCQDPDKSDSYGVHFLQRPILIELLVPKGTPAIYIDNVYAELLLPRGSSYKVDDISIFNDILNNRESIKIKAHLVTK